MNRLILVLLTLTLWNLGQTQILKPVKWSFDIRKAKDKEYDLTFTATIDKGWTVYSQ